MRDDYSRDNIENWKWNHWVSAILSLFLFSGGYALIVWSILGFVFWLADPNFNSFTKIIIAWGITTPFFMLVAWVYGGR